MIQLEYNNKDLCASCQKCCKYPEDLHASEFVTKKDGDFFDNAYEQYGVRPLRNPEIELGEYCEFHDASIGCIIPRENRPLICRIFVCDELLQDFSNIEKIHLEEPHKDMIPVGFIIDPSENRVIPMHEDIDIIGFETTAKNRVNICMNCDQLIKRGDRFACKKCGCALLIRAFRVYPTDSEGKAISQVFSDGSYHYVCPLKKW